MEQVTAKPAGQKAGDERHCSNRRVSTFLPVWGQCCARPLSSRSNARTLPFCRTWAAVMMSRTEGRQRTPGRHGPAYRPPPGRFRRPASDVRGHGRPARARQDWRPCRAQSTARALHSAAPPLGAWTAAVSRARPARYRRSRPGNRHRGVGPAGSLRGPLSRRAPGVSPPGVDEPGARSDSASAAPARAGVHSPIGSSTPTRRRWNRRSAPRASRPTRRPSSGSRAADREAVIGRIELGYSYEELAVALDKPTAAAARMAVTRAVKRLAGEMLHG